MLFEGFSILCVCHSGFKYVGFRKRPLRPVEKQTGEALTYNRKKVGHDQPLHKTNNLSFVSIETLVVKESPFRSPVHDEHCVS
jgi:hypothetical protein